MWSKTDSMLGLLSSCRVTSRENIQLDNDIPVLDNIKEEDMITSIANWVGKKHSKKKAVRNIMNNKRAVLILYKTWYVV